MKNLLTIAALAAIAGAAHADFNTGIGAGPFNSDGAAGNAANGVFSFTYTGSNADVFNRIRIRGTATSGGVGSYLSELRWRFVGPSTLDSGAIASGTTWTGDRAVDNTQTFSTFSLVNGTTYSFRFWESFNDGGIDATWSNVQFDFLSFVPPTPPTAVSIGTFTAGAFDINTFGSNFDTEIGLYDSAGNIVSINDDAGAGLQSQITPTLAIGTYYLAVGGYNTAFNAGWDAVAGAATGLFDLTVNGFASIEDQLLSAGQVKWYSFNVVPTPGSFALLGFAGLAAARRRR